MAELLLILGVLLGFIAAVAFLMGLLHDSASGWIVATISGILFLVRGGVLFGCSSYIAGRGDSEKFAKEWVNRWRPGSEVECQPYDSDDNGYVSCTVGWMEGNSRQVEAIECGVNRWYHGYRNEDCRLMKGYSGSQ